MTLAAAALRRCLRRVACLAALAPAGCATPGEGLDAEAVARAAGLVRNEVATPAHRLVTWARIARPGEPVRVYVEGDGFAFVTPREPSRDPTPRNPVALRLAAADPWANVLYVARPCQFGMVGADPACRTAAWTDARYGEPVVAAVDAAIDDVVRRSGAPSVELTGFSGGGTVAALVAARRPDVAALRTVAANLDHVVWTRHHGVTPLRGSLNAADVAPALADLAQVHFVGTADRVVPRAVVESFAARTGGAACVAIVAVPGAAHDEPWAALWATLLRERLPC